MPGEASNFSEQKVAISMGTRFLALWALIFCCSISNAEEPVEIPLSEIWALDMPGTKPMSVGMRGGKYVSEEGALLDDIRNYLGQRLDSEVYQGLIRAGFAVLGTDIKAIQNAHKVLIEHGSSQEVFDTRDSLSIVVFSHTSTWYVHLHDVIRKGNQIVVRYKFVPHNTANVSRHFALIPLHDLPEGNYDVILQRLPLEKQYVDAGLKPRPENANGLVCRSFSFTVKEGK